MHPHFPEMTEGCVRDVDKYKCPSRRINNQLKNWNTFFLVESEYRIFNKGAQN